MSTTKAPPKKKQTVIPYNDQHSFLYEHHQTHHQKQHSLEDGDKLAFETIVDEEKKLEDSEFKKSEFEKTKSLIKIGFEMIKHTDWEWSDSIGLGYYLNFRKDKIIKDYSYMIDESFKFNQEKRVFESNPITTTTSTTNTTTTTTDTSNSTTIVNGGVVDDISFETVEIWKEYIMCIRYLFKEYNNFIIKTSFDYADVLEYEPKGNSERSAYAIVRDLKRKKLLLLIEGTKTFHDLLTDLNTDAVSFECEAFKNENIVNQFVHSGMLDRAYWFYYQIIPKIENYLQTDFPDYSFEMVGHSLGSGTAAILTLLIIPRLPNVKCLAFACPKIFSHELAKSDLVKRHITTFINQDDFVPLFSVESFRDFKTNRMVNWKSEVMNETQLGKFLQGADQFMDKNGVYGAFNSVKNTFKSGYDYIVNGSQGSTGSISGSIVISKPKKQKKLPPPLPKNLLQKRLIKLQEYKEDEIDEEDENFFLNLVKEYESDQEQQQACTTEEEEIGDETKEVENQTNPSTLTDDQPQQQQQEVAVVASPEEDIVVDYTTQTTPVMEGVDEASDPNSSINEEDFLATTTTSTSSSSMRDLPPLPKSFITGVHLYSPENILYFRTINDRTYMKKCVPSEFEQLNFGQKYVADHFSSSYINAIVGVLDSITAVQQTPSSQQQQAQQQLPPLPTLQKKYEQYETVPLVNENVVEPSEIVLPVLPILTDTKKKTLPPLPAHLLKAKSPPSPVLSSNNDSSAIVTESQSEQPTTTVISTTETEQLNVENETSSPIIPEDPTQSNIEESITESELENNITEQPTISTETTLNVEVSSAVEENC